MGRNYIETGLDDIIKKDPVFTNYFNIHRYLKHNTIKTSRFFKLHRYPAHFGNVKRHEVRVRKPASFFLDRQKKEY